MSNELEKQFFQSFGFEPKTNREYGYKMAIYNEAGTEEIKFYPQITDRILLGLICIWNNACLYLEDSIAPANYQKVTETVLEYFVDIENYRFAIGKQEIKHQVRTLFKEE